MEILAFTETLTFLEAFALVWLAGAFVVATIGSACVLSAFSGKRS